MGWYVLFVETGKESIIERWIRVFLKENECTSVVPKKMISERKKGIVKDVKKTIFPGYVFLDMQMSFEKYYKLKEIPRFLRILNNGDYYSEIRQCEMAMILKLLGNSDIIDYSKGYMENSRIVICEGPLKGMDGLIKRVDKRRKRVTIEIEFLNEIRRINLGIEFIEKV